MPLIHAVLFDMIGTTVKEKKPSFINDCFGSAFSDHGITVTREQIRANRGMDKREAITNILREFNGVAVSAGLILDSFTTHISNNLDNFQEMEGTKEVIGFLKRKKIYVGIGTGLSRNLFDLIFHHLNWQAYRFDYIGMAENVGRGRPHPDMILEMLGRFSVEPSSFLKVGDTVADIEEGKNAKVLTVAMASGTQDIEVLKKHKPDFLIRSLLELQTIIS
jgi:phosphonoacetaldehyde hydrolase